MSISRNSKGRIRTYQKIASVRPLPENNKIGIMVGCGNCATFRVFIISETLKDIIGKISAGYVIETECEKCGHLISATIAWVSDVPNFSYRPLDGRMIHEKPIIVTDANGLR